MNKLIPPNDFQGKLGQGARYGVRGLVVGAISGLVLGGMATLFFQNTWFFILIPVFAWIGYFVRKVRLDSKKIEPPNVRW